MITTNLVELLRDISLKLGVLIKTSKLPKSITASEQQQQHQVYIATDTTDTNTTPNLQISASSGSKQDSIIDNNSVIVGCNKTTNQSMSAQSMQPAADLLANNNNNHQSHNYDYIYNKSTSCNSSRASIGSIIEQDEVRSVIVTGCGSKIGRKIAIAFARLDFNIALVDFNIKQTEFVADECQEASSKNRVPLQIVADISQLDEAHKVIDQAVKEFGRLDVLVNTINNAALMEAHFTGGQSDDDPHVFEQYHRIIANNMHSVTYLCISAAPHLRRSKGSIVNVSSISENDHGSYKFAYCMSKAGIWTLTKCLATDYAPDINMICVSDQPTQSSSSSKSSKETKSTLSSNSLETRSSTSSSGKSDSKESSQKETRSESSTISSPSSSSSSSMHFSEINRSTEITIEKSASSTSEQPAKLMTQTKDLTKTSICSSDSSQQNEPDYICQTVEHNIK